MRKANVLAVVILVVLATVLGATVFREQVASAAQLLNVEVVNSAANPVPVIGADNPAFEPVQAVFDEFPDSGLVRGTIYTVPAGKRLVIEQVGVSSGVLANGRLTITFITTSAGGVFANWHIPMVFDPGVVVGSYKGITQTRLYADPEQNVTCTLVANQTLDRTVCTISGYLVPLD